jgi:hypothetical protein
LSWARCICVRFCNRTHAITTTSERIDHWKKMRRSLARFSLQEASNRIPSLVDFITITPGFKFSVHTTRVVYRARTCACSCLRACVGAAGRWTSRSLGAPVLRLECLTPRSSRRSTRPSSAFDQMIIAPDAMGPTPPYLPRERVRSLALLGPVGAASRCLLSGGYKRT